MRGGAALYPKHLRHCNGSVGLGCSCPGRELASSGGTLLPEPERVKAQQLFVRASHARCPLFAVEKANHLPSFLRHENEDPVRRLSSLGDHLAALLFRGEKKVLKPRQLLSRQSLVIRKRRAASPYPPGTRTGPIDTPRMGLRYALLVLRARAFPVRILYSTAIPRT